MTTESLDAAFAEAALRGGLLTSAQMRDARRAQAAESPVPPLALVLVERSLLTPVRVADLYARHLGIWRRVDGRVPAQARAWRAAALVLARGWASPGVVQAALRARLAGPDAGASSPRLEETLIAQGALSAGQGEEARRVLEEAEAEDARLQDPTATLPSDDDAAGTTARDEGVLPPPRPLAPARRSAGEPRRLGKYELREVLGHGGMGVVYKAWHVGLHAECAVKVLRAGEDASREELQRFRREAQAMARLHHPGIVAVHDIGEEDGRTYMAMEYVEGLTLSRVLEDRTARGGSAGLPAPQAIRWVREMAEAVQAAHDAGVLHRDLKPQNVLIDGSGRVRVMDFGLAKMAQGADAAGATRTGALLGTPAYMSPEHVNEGMSAVDAQSDVYQIGAVLYELLTGRRAYPQASPSEAMLTIAREEPPPPSKWVRDLDRDAETICLVATAREKPRRYASARALADDCARFLAGESIHARPEGWLGRLRRWVRRRRATAALAGAAVLAVVVALSAAQQAWEAEAERARVRLEREAAEREKRRLEDEVVDAVRRIADSSVKAVVLIRRAGGDPGTRAAAFLAPVEEAAHEASAKAPARPEPHVQRARVLRALRDRAAAAAEIETALGKQDGFPPARYERLWLAADALASGTGGAPDAEWRRTLAADAAALAAESSGLAPAQRLCARALGRLHADDAPDAEGARRSFEEALRVDPDLEDARAALENLGAGPSNSGK